MAILIIRRQQMDALSRGALEQRALTQAKKFFPEQAASLGQAGVQRSIQKARILEITAPRDILQYVQLVLVFGEGFEAAAWAQRALNQPKEYRAVRLYEAALRQLKHAQ